MNMMITTKGGDCLMSSAISVHSSVGSLLGQLIMFEAAASMLVLLSRCCEH